MKNNLKDKTIITVTHFSVTGPPQNLEEFLINQKISKLFSISHPLYYQQGQNGSGWKLYERGALKEEGYLENKKRPDLLNYLKDVFLNIWWVLKTKDRWELYIGADNLNAFCGLVLKKMRKVKKVVYYTIDFIPVNRFENKFLDKIYHWLDIFSVKYCDEVWNLSPRMIEGRGECFGLDKRFHNKQKLVPEGVWFDRIKKHPFVQINKHAIVFLGHLVPRLGVQEAVKAVPEIVKIIPDFKFIIIGKGDYADTLKKIATELGVEKYIDFKGFIEDHKEVENIIAKCALGIATYSKDKDSFSYYADPSKTKVYMGSGVPVIMTDIFYNAKEIEQAKGGKVVEYDKDSIARAIIEFMKDEEKLKKYRENAINYMKKLDWNIIFSNALKNSLQ